MDGNCQLRSTVEKGWRVVRLHCAHFVTLRPFVETVVTLGPFWETFVTFWRCCQLRTTFGLLAYSQSLENCQLRPGCYVRFISGDICYLRSSFEDVYQLGCLLNCQLIPNLRELVSLDSFVMLGPFLETFVTLGLVLEMFVSLG